METGDDSSKAPQDKLLKQIFFVYSGGGRVSQSRPCSAQKSITRPTFREPGRQTASEFLLRPLFKPKQLRQILGELSAVIHRHIWNDVLGCRRHRAAAWAELRIESQTIRSSLSIFPVEC